MKNLIPQIVLELVSLINKRFSSSLTEKEKEKEKEKLQFLIEQVEQKYKDLKNFILYVAVGQFILTIVAMSAIVTMVVNKI